jgi:hypothetical protein
MEKLLYDLSFRVNIITDNVVYYKTAVGPKSYIRATICHNIKKDCWEYVLPGRGNRRILTTWDVTVFLVQLGYLSKK